MSLPLLGISGYGAPAFARTVSAVRLSESGGATRLLLDLDEPFDWELFALGGPDRLVLDMMATGWRAPRLQEGTGLVRALRHGLFRANQSRLVLDLHRPVALKRAGFEAAGAGRRGQFVVELAPGSRASFLRIQASGRAASALGRGAVRSARAQPARPQATPPERNADRAGRAARVRPVIVVDPGHGGIDPGAIGVSGTKEKHVTLLAARELKRQLDATRRYVVHLTRRADSFVALRDRVAMAERQGAHLFISIHADAIDDASIRGASVYTLGERSSDAVAEQISRRENRADERAGLRLPDVTPEVARILASLVRRETSNQSARVARKTVEELERTVPMLPRSHRYASFVVLKSAEVPSMLVELGFMSNRQDEALLRRPEHRRRVVAAVTRAVERHFASTPVAPAGGSNT